MQEHEDTKNVQNMVKHSGKAKAHANYKPIRSN